MPSAELEANRHQEMAMPVPSGRELLNLLDYKVLRGGEAPKSALGAPAEMRGSTQNARPD
jgi:hypothetical protein